MLAEAVSEIEDAAIPADAEMILLDAVTDPEAAHVHSLGTPKLHCVISNAGGGGVVSLDRRRSLREAKIIQGVPDRNGFTTVVKETTEFCLSG